MQRVFTLISLVMLSLYTMTAFALKCPSPDAIKAHWKKELMIVKPEREGSLWVFAQYPQKYDTNQTWVLTFVLDGRQALTQEMARRRFLDAFDGITYVPEVVKMCVYQTSDVQINGFASQA